MHTSSYDIKGLGEVIVHHNGDWSGDAIIMYGRKEVPRYEMRGTKRIPLEPGVEYEHEIKLPGALVIGLCRQAAVDYLSREMISFLEQLEVKI